MNTSPRTSSVTGRRSRSGTERMVRTLAVMSSPRAPSPLVAARTSTPFSYVSDTLRAVDFQLRHVRQVVHAGQPARTSVESPQIVG